MILSIIIINWKSRNLLKLCLHSIIKDEKGFSYEIIIIDNNSNDGSIEMVSKEFPNVRIYANKKNLGFSKAVNQGIRLSRGKNIFILNPDIIIKKNCIQVLLSKIKKNNAIGAIGPKIIKKNGVAEFPYIKFPSLMQIILFHTAIKRITLKSNLLRGKFLEINKNINDNPQEVELIPGGCLFLKKSVVKKVGYMDTRFFLWFEDTDYCLRMKKNKYKLFYEPNAVVIHAGGGSTKKLSTYEYLNIFYTSMFKYFYKHNGYTYATLSLSIMILNMLSTSLLIFLLPVLNRKQNYTYWIKCRLKLALSWINVILGRDYGTTVS